LSLENFANNKRSGRICQMTLKRGVKKGVNDKMGKN
jgi:hypothetical protein